jgi:hypothetical protein
MNSRNPKIEAIGGQAFRVGDCRVWAEIYYLDSPTHYREYINTDARHNNLPEGHELMMLTDITPFSVARVCCKFIRRCLTTSH